MRKLQAILLLFFLLASALPQAAGAQEAPPALDAAAPGAYAAAAEAGVKEAGLELATEATLVWGGLPLLDDELNAVLASFLKAFRLETYSQGSGGEGYGGVSMHLSNVSVLDLTMLSAGGTYYEQSNLLGGQTVAFTQEEFAAFARRLSKRSGGLLPADLTGLFEGVTRLLAGPDAAIEADTLEKALAALDQWGQSALTRESLPRPETLIPGIYGARADVMDVSREEAVALARAVGALLANEDALWENTVRAQFPESDANGVQEMLTRIADTLDALPQALESALPKDMPPVEYREVFSQEELLVAKQVEMLLPGSFSLTVEWLPTETGMPPLFVSLAAQDAGLTLLFTREDGSPVQTGKIQRARNRYVAQLSLFAGDTRAELTMTRVETIERREGKEIIVSKTDLMAQSDALLGENAVVTLTAQRTDTAAGAGKEYTRARQTVLTLKGLGFDDRTVLTVSENTVARPASPPFDLAEEVIHPALLADEAFDQWVDNIQVSLLQASYTVLGRLPSDVAAYVLKVIDRMNN